MSTLKHDNYEECEEDEKCDWWGDRERRSRKGGGRVNILNTGPALITSHYWPSKTEGATGINCFYFSS